VETKRGYNIPDEAYLEVLFMLIDYSVRSFELLERKLTAAEQREVFDVFYRVGERMGLIELPQDHSRYMVMRREQLNHDLKHGDLTTDLFRQYRKHLGVIRYWILKQAQVLVAPEQVNRVLKLGSIPWLLPVVYIYKCFRLLKLQNILKDAILPKAYVNQVHELDIA
jgi:hypothetical protein